MTPEHASASLTNLRREGAVLLRGVFAELTLAVLRDASAACFDAIAAGRLPAEHYRFSPFSQSVVVAALLDFGCPRPQDLIEPLAVAGLDTLLGGFACNLNESWVRKRFAPHHAPPRYQPNRWHQDGGLGVRFPESPGPPVPMTHMVTCWLPLDPCGADAPGLEFVRRPLDELLHFTELDDALLRRRFREDEFWAPVLAPGDGVLFLDGTLHRTYVRPEMQDDRLSVEYRFFPPHFTT